MSFIDKIFRREKLNVPFRSSLYAGGSIPPDFTGQDFLNSYTNIGWWHAVVFRIALGMSEVKWTLSDVSNKDQPKQILEHPLLDLLHLVNPFQTSEEFMALDTIYMECAGESFWILNFNALGEPSEAVLAYPSMMSVVPAKAFPFVKGYVYGTGQNAIPLDVNDVIHFKFPNPLNQYRGLGQAKAIGVNLSAEQNADRWVNQFFYNSARPDGVIQFDYNLSDEQFEKLKKQWSEKYRGVNKSHQVGLLEGGGKYIQIQNTVKDMDFPNLKLKNRDMILGVEGMPQSVMGISENVNKANAEAGEYQYARNIIKPRLDWKRSKLQEQLIPKFRNSSNLKLGFEEVVPETVEQKRELAESGMRAGYLTINEARKLQELDPLPNGDVLLIPLNLLPTPISGDMTTPQETPEEPPEEERSSHKRELWDIYNEKTLRQEQMFTSVFNNVFDEQKDYVVDIFEKTNDLPISLNDEETARRFEQAIEMVYVGGFESALPKQFDLLDEHALEWITTRSLLLAKSINKTNLEGLRLALQEGYAQGESIQQLTNRISGFFDETKKWKAEQVARTEVIAASNEGALHRYETSGIEKSEFFPNPDACPECVDLIGIYPTNESHGIIPVHPNCRCVWLPVV